MPACARAVEGEAEAPDQPVVVGEADRGRVGVRRVGRLARAVGVGMEREAVHHRERPAARAVGGAHVLEEGDGRVRVAAGAGPVDAARRERAAPDARGRVDGLDRVVGPGEEGEVGRRGGVACRRG